MNDSETLIKILDCSFSTPQRPNVNENAVDLIRSLLRKDPRSRLTIRQILEHPWLREEQPLSSPNAATADQHSSPVASQNEIKESDLEEEPVFRQQTVLDDEMAELRKKLSSVESYDKSKNFDEQLHDSVIEQMLTKGMCNSKEQVETAIKCSRKIANASKHEIVKKIIPNQEELNDQAAAAGQADGDDKNARDCYNTDNKLINQHLEENSTLTEKEDREKAYLTATYNLIKDKISREQQGIHLTNQVQSKLMHHKKVLPTRPRKSIIKQPQFGLASAGGISRPDSAGSCELNESAEEQQKFNDLLVNNKSVAELPVYEEDSNGLFMLPLARKCSIVSEEGSCIANSDYSGNEYSSDINSGHNSIGNYNSLNDYSLNAELNKVRSHSYLNNNQSNNSSKRNSRENLKIQSMPLVNIVITDFSNTIEEDERLEIDEFNNCTVKNEQGTTVCQSTDEQEHRKSGYFCPTSSSLHQASSSPDLGREEKLSEQKSDLVISKEDEDQNANQFDEHVINQLNQLNQSSSGKGSLHTSMRVIMQSKSCNNILCSGLDSKEEHCSDCEMSKPPDKQKLQQQQQQQQQADQLSNQESAKDPLPSTDSNNLSLFGRIIGKRLQSQKDDGSTKKRLSLNLEPDEALAAKDKLNASSGSPAFKECKTDKINCCAMS